MTIRKDAQPQSCGCGCGALTTPGRQFLPGHNSKLKTRRSPDGNRLWCPRCEAHKPLDAFPFKGRHRNGEARYGYCKPCASSYQREKKLERIFNISAEEYDHLLDGQGGGCAICSKPPLEKMRLCIDHDHDTGLIRGLICPACNHGLGYWKDSLERLQAAVDYMTSPPAVAILGGARYGRTGSSQVPYGPALFKRGQGKAYVPVAERA